MHAKTLKKLSWILLILQPGFFVGTLFVMASDGGYSNTAYFFVRFGLLCAFIFTLIPGFTIAAFYKLYEKEKGAWNMIGLILSIIYFIIPMGFGLVALIPTFLMLKIKDEKAIDKS